MKIGIIVSEFNGEITSRMLLAAREKAQSLKITISATNHVPGAYDIPIIADALLQRSDVDAVVIIHGKMIYCKLYVQAFVKYSCLHCALCHRRSGPCIMAPSVTTASTSLL